MRRRERTAWNDIGRQWKARSEDQLWRRCSDAIHEVWLGSVVPVRPFDRTLKTDLFDEAFGDGLASWFSRRGSRVVGCDLALETAHCAREIGHCTTAVSADVRSLPFAPGSFDCVLSNSTLDHFETEEKLALALKEIAGVLRPGGILLLTMDNPRHPVVWLRNGWPRLWRGLGVVPYAMGLTVSATRLEELLRRPGFEILHATTIFHSPRVVLVALCGWLARHRGWATPPSSWLRMLALWERLGRLPTRQITRHFVAIVARRCG